MTKLISLPIFFLLFAFTVNITRAEECIYITQVPIVLNDQGVYCFDRHWVVRANSGNMITINNNNITLDMKGFKLGNRAAAITTKATGIRATSQVNITVRNGIIRGFLIGIRISGDGILVENNLVEYSYFAGVHVEGMNNVIRNNRIQNVGNAPGETFATGISMPDSERVQIINNTISNVEQSGKISGIGISESKIIEIKENSIYDLKRASNKYGVEIQGGSENVNVANNTFINAGPSDGIGIRSISSTGIYCTGNTVIGYLSATSGCDYVSSNHAR